MPEKKVTAAAAAGTIGEGLVLSAEKRGKTRMYNTKPGTEVLREAPSGKCMKFPDAPAAARPIIIRILKVFSDLDRLRGHDLVDSCVWLPLPR